MASEQQKGTFVVKVGLAQVSHALSVRTKPFGDTPDEALSAIEKFLRFFGSAFVVDAVTAGWRAASTPTTY